MTEARGEFEKLTKAGQLLVILTTTPMSVEKAANILNIDKKNMGRTIDRANDWCFGGIIVKQHKGHTTHICLNGATYEKIQLIIPKTVKEQLLKK